MNPRNSAQTIAGPLLPLRVSASSASLWPWKVERRTASWISFEIEDEAPSARSDLGTPGLWKTIRRGTRFYRVFEVPLWTADESDGLGDEDGEGDRADLGIFRLWAREAAGGRVPLGWQTPAPETADAWLPQNALTLHRYGILRQGRMIREPDCWALRIPIVPMLSPDLPEPRRRGLEQLLFDAQSRWAMVRLGIRSREGKERAECEVDLTGAPHTEALLLTAVDALRNATLAVLEEAECLSDLRVEMKGPALCAATTPTKGNEDEAGN